MAARSGGAPTAALRQTGHRSSAGLRQRPAGFRWFPGVRNSLHRCPRSTSAPAWQILFDQEVHRHAKRAGEFLLQLSRALASTGFNLGQIVLADADRNSEFALDHVAPFTDDTYRAFAVGEAIGHGFRQHDLAAFLDGAR